MRAAVVAILALMALAAPAQAQSPAYRFLHSDDPVADANAYLLTLLAADPQARAALAADPDLAALHARLTEARAAAIKACRTASACPVDQLMLSDAEIAGAGDALARLAQPGGPLNRLVRDQLRPSGRAQKNAALDDAGLIRVAWADAAKGLNRLYRVYALAEKPRYAEIDSISYAPGDPHFRQMLREALEVSADHETQALPFHAWSAVAFDLLAVNQRDEAARYEPLETGENAAAFARARKTDWRAKPYTAIVVPGMGTEGAEVHVSPVGAFRDRLAVKRWREGVAPFLIVSGGHVHPNKTPFAEAIEMKHDLMAHYGVPADAIVVDPYARHTTTNLRNATRLLFHMGAPLDRPVLITTSEDQSLSIELPAFAVRNTAELGYQPMTAYRRLSPFDLAATPNIVSLQADPQDPLDP
ncbi:YdcF family protein [Phenylobacterium sp.]|uniref:YdcF family protein n=1 Tax=Phenylobacterium sp. TaxID=1871053 RepID=UPI00121DDEE5|nr:YdcF family protein [Phenylobacterium sp.]THD60693.1 MAG: YdcF family protein [Phenylobacterium sp.]